METYQLEFRTVLPISLEQFQVGEIYTTVEMTKDMNERGANIEPILTRQVTSDCNEYMTPMDVTNLLDDSIKILLPLHFDLTVNTWDLFPKYRSEITNPDYFNDNFYFEMFTECYEDYGEKKNVFNLSDEERKSTQVINIDISKPVSLSSKPFSKQDYDPSTFHSTKTGAGPLVGEWVEALKQNKSKPHICIYKLIKYRLDIPNNRYLVHQIQKYALNLTREFMSRLYCTIDHWNGLTVDEARAMENRV